MLTAMWSKASKSGPSGNCVELKFASAEKSNGNGGNNCVEIAFDTATKSGAEGHCVEVGFDKASKSGPNGDNCVEVGHTGNDFKASSTSCDCGVSLVQGEKIIDAGKKVFLRDSKDKGKGAVFTYTIAQWAEFTAEVLQHGMGWPLRSGTHFVVDEFTNGPLAGRKLYFTGPEWDAFLDGLRKNEFALPVGANA